MKKWLISLTNYLKIKNKCKSINIAKILQNSAFKVSLFFFNSILFDFEVELLNDNQQKHEYYKIIDNELDYCLEREFESSILGKILEKGTKVNKITYANYFDEDIFPILNISFSLNTLKHTCYFFDSLWLKSLSKLWADLIIKFEMFHSKNAEDIEINVKHLNEFAKDVKKSGLNLKIMFSKIEIIFRAEEIFLYRNINFYKLQNNYDNISYACYDSLERYTYETLSNKRNFFDIWIKNDIWMFEMILRYFKIHFKLNKYEINQNEYLDCKLN